MMSAQGFDCPCISLCKPIAYHKVNNKVHNRLPVSVFPVSREKGIQQKIHLFRNELYMSKPVWKPALPVYSVVNHL
jgi:hypothetical protein